MRNTDLDWTNIGDTEPFYGVLANPMFLKENLSPENLKAFWRAGRLDVNYFLLLVRQHFGEFTPKTALDFGCGVGRLTRGIAKHVDQVTGVDISPGMLRHARRGAPRNAHFVRAIPDEPVDWIVSHIVFQHIPPPRGYALFRQLLDRLAPGGAFVIQFTLYKDETFLEKSIGPVTRANWDGETLRTYDQAPHPAGTMLMYDYDLTHLTCIIHDAGINAAHMVHTNHGGCHGVILCGRKPGD